MLRRLLLRCLRQRASIRLPIIARAGRKGGLATSGKRQRRRRHGREQCHPSRTGRRHRSLADTIRLRAGCGTAGPSRSLPRPLCLRRHQRRPTTTTAPIKVGAITLARMATSRCGRAVAGGSHERHRARPTSARPTVRSSRRSLTAAWIARSAAKPSVRSCGFTSVFYGRLITSPEDQTACPEPWAT